MVGFLLGCVVATVVLLALFRKQHVSKPHWSGPVQQREEAPRIYSQTYLARQAAAVPVSVRAEYSLSRSLLLVGLDTETTGLDENECGVISVGIHLHYMDTGESEEKLWEVNPSREGLVVMPEALAKNGYRVEDFAGFRDPAEFYPKLADDLRALPDPWVIIGSNPDFDIRFLNAEFERWGVNYRITRRNYFDTAKEALKAHYQGRILLPVKPNGDVTTNLEVVARTLGVGEQGAVHNALHDARLAVAVFLELND